jgi:hypothetical protein
MRRSPRGERQSNAAACAQAEEGAKDLVHALACTSSLCVHGGPREPARPAGRQALAPLDHYGIEGTPAYDSWGRPLHTEPGAHGALAQFSLSALWERCHGPAW